MVNQIGDSASVHSISNLHYLYHMLKIMFKNLVGLRGKLIWLFPVIFACISFTIQAQNTAITGNVVDDNEQPIPYAAVAIYSLPDSAVVDGTTSGEDGKFKMLVEPGQYYIKISFLSYQDKVIPDIQVGDSPVKLGTQTLHAKAESLDEVVIEEERSQLELKLDKKVFNVGKDLSTTGGNAADILDKVPSVSVDVEGNISLRGSQNVRILVNGKPSGLVSSGDPQSLRQLQGNLIESIEVITNPSAKYDAEGEVGIINIILKEQNKKGINGSFDITTGYPHDHGAAVNLNYRKSWFNLFLSEGVSWDKDPGKGNTFQEYFFPDTSYAYERIRNQTRSDLSNNLRLGADFYITPKDIITASGLYQYSTGKNLSTTTYNDYNDQGMEVGTIERYQDEYEVEHEIEADLSYKKEFNRKGHEWTIDAKYDLSKDVEDAQYDEDDFSTAADVDAVQRSNNLEYRKAWLFQTDYVHPFGNEGKFETGLKAHLRNFDNDYLVEDQISQGEWEPLDLYNNEFIYTENIYAAYAMAGEKWGDFSAKAGLRVEYSDIRTELVRTGEKNPRSYIDFFPSAFLGYRIKKKNTIQASYSRRISRPRFWYLVPFLQYADSRNYRSGNPDLNPEYTHSFELGYQRYLEKGSLLSSVYYRYRTGVFERITFVEPSGLTRSIPVNLATENDFGLEFSMNYDIKDWWTANGNINFYRAVTKGSYEGDNLNSDTYSMHLQASTKVTIVKRLDVQCSLRYRSPRKTSQGRRKASYSVDLGASIDVFKKKGTITLSVRDLFDTRRHRWVTEGENFRTEGNFQWRTARQVKLSFNYRLNKEKKPQRGGGGNDGGFDDTF